MGATVMEVTTNPRDTEAMEGINHKAMAAILIPMHLPRNTKNPTVLLILTPHLLKKPLKRSKAKLKLQQHMKNLQPMEDISPLMAVTDLNLTVHHPQHLTVHLPQHMAVMAKPTHHLHLMNLTVHPLHLHMAVMAKPTHHLHLPHLIHPQHMEDIANPHPHHNLTVKPMVIKNPRMATLHPHHLHTGTATLHPRTASQPMEVMLPMIN